VRYSTYLRRLSRRSRAVESLFFVVIDTRRDDSAEPDVWKKEKEIQ
jgi:hypothetical protein